MQVALPLFGMASRSVLPLRALRPRPFGSLERTSSWGLASLAATEDMRGWLVVVELVCGLRNPEPQQLRAAAPGLAGLVVS